MRRVAGLLVVTVLFAVPALTAFGANASYEDDFSEVSYSGNDGSLEFAGPWEEFGDNGVVGTGKVHVGDENCWNNRCLHIEGPGLLLLVEPFGIARSADTSVFQAATLRYDIEVVPQPLDTGGQLLVEVRNGGGWVTMATYDLSKSLSKTAAISVNAYLGPDFEVRFQVPALVGLTFNGDVSIDRVSLSGPLVPPTTTTTSSTTSTTTTTAPTTTSTTAPTTTSTTAATTTSTTAPPPTSTTSGRATTTSTTSPTSTTSSVATTTTTSADTTTSLVVAAPPQDQPPEPFVGGIRDTGSGIIANYQKGMNGDIAALAGVEVLSAEVTTEFSMAVEAFEAARVWLGALSLMIAAALVSGVDHRRNRMGDFSLRSAAEPLVQG